MMESEVMNDTFQDRLEAGTRMSKMLAAYRNTNAVVVGIPHGGVCVATVIAEALSLPLEIIPCRKIKHPADARKTIGSVSINDVFMHDCPNAIPQDYIQHQILLLRQTIAQEMKMYYGKLQPVSLQYRPVILVDDILNASDTMMACLRTIRKQRPLKIVVAVPVVAAEAARIVGAASDDFKFIKMDSTLESPHRYFTDFPRVKEKMVKEIFDTSRKPKAGVTN